MPYDLTNSVDKAIQQAESWSIKEVFRIARLLQKLIPGTTLEWEWKDLDYWSDFTKIQVEWNHMSHDEKTWLSITKGKERVAYLRIDFPLVFLLDKYAEEIQNNEDFTTIETILTPNFGQ
jgi:hypothetical protein